MNPKQNLRPSHQHEKDDRYDRDRDGEPGGVDRVNPFNTENQGGDPAARDERSGDPAEPRPRRMHINRSWRGRSQPDLD